MNLNCSPMTCLMSCRLIESSMLCSQLHRCLDSKLGIKGLLPLDGAVLFEVEGLIFNLVVLSDVSVLSYSQEWFDALRIVAQSKDEILFSLIDFVGLSVCHFDIL